MDVLSATLGAACGAGLFHGMRHLREHRATPAGVTDLLLWAFLVDEGVVLQKDGSLVAAWAYRGPDLDAATTEELAALSQHLNQAFLPLVDAWMFHVDAIRRPAAPYPVSVFPNTITAIIDAERRAAYTQAVATQFETQYVLTVTYLPPTDVYDRLTRWFIRGGSSTPMDWSAHLAAFHAGIQALEGRLSAQFRLDRLSSDALLTHLHACLHASTQSI